MIFKKCRNLNFNAKKIKFYVLNTSNTFLWVSEEIRIPVRIRLLNRARKNNAAHSFCACIVSTKEQRIRKFLGISMRFYSLVMLTWGRRSEVRFPIHCTAGCTFIMPAKRKICMTKKSNFSEILLYLSTCLGHWNATCLGHGNAAVKSLRKICTEKGQ